MNLILFDIDGTLAISTQSVLEHHKKILRNLVEKGYILGLAGGSSYDKIKSQFGNEINLFEYVFSECGSVCHMNGNLVKSNSIIEKLGNEYLNDIINTCLKYISILELPMKRGNFILFRNSMLYVSPMGSMDNVNERKIFMEFDEKHLIRKHMTSFLQSKYSDLDITIGGQLGISKTRK
jgi:phosphomannomutase